MRTDWAIGDNTKAALITRGIAEIARLGVKMGGKLETFTGLTGIGDLIVTCASVHSRNRKGGVSDGTGKTMEEAMEEVKEWSSGRCIFRKAAAESWPVNTMCPLPIVDADQCGTV